MTSTLRRPGRGRRTDKELSPGDRAKILREAVSFYVRTTLREPEIQEVCEAFIAAIDRAARNNVEPPLPEVPDVAEVSISPTTGTAPVSGGSGGILVSVVSPGTWMAVSDQPWLTFSPTTEQSLNATLNWMVALNGTGNARVGHLDVNGEIFTVNQDGTAPAAEVSITPVEETVLATGGSGSIAVTVTAPGTWTVDSNMSWLTFTPTTPQLADGTVNWTAAANTTGLPRVGQLDINGVTFTVNQGAI